MIPVKGLQYLILVEYQRFWNIVTLFEMTHYMINQQRLEKRPPHGDLCKTDSINNLYVVWIRLSKQAQTVYNPSKPE